MSNHTSSRHSCAPVTGHVQGNPRPSCCVRQLAHDAGWQNLKAKVFLFHFLSIHSHLHCQRNVSSCLQGNALCLISYGDLRLSGFVWFQINLLVLAALITKHFDDAHFMIVV